MTIDQFNFAGKKAFVRVDFNVPLDENFNITDDTRMRAALPTLKKILADGGSIIIGSHLGRPKGVTEKFSLKHILKHLNELLGVEVQFANDCMGEEAAVKAAALKPGEVLLLENLRFYAEEEGKPRGLADDATDEEKAAAKKAVKESQKEFTKKLASYADCYVNDAFGTAHRAHASTALIAKYFDKDNKMFGYLMERYDCAVDVEELREDEEAPVILKNNPFSANMEGIVESYGLPHKGEIDPTTVMSFFYIFFFGMMLSDAAYGALVALVCGILVRKFPGMSPGMKKSLKLFFYCGLSTLVWGILFGGYFGNIVDVVSEKFFGHTVTVPALWFIPLNDPMKLLVYSLLFGVIHLFVGLGIKGYLCLKDKKYMDFFCDVVLWFMLLAGLILMLLPSDIFASIAQTEIVFPPVLNRTAQILAAAGAIGIVLMSGRGNRNPALRLALGAYDLYNITGWLSDVLSYSRLLALGLATGVIASVINQMGTMLPDNIIGVVFFILIFLVGHAMNLAINLLGAYVHTNRLQFVEFFGKFYEGGGRPFSPFKENTKYTEVKEETLL